MPRVPVAKTYKMFIGGKFPRTESGRYDPLTDKAGNLIANVSRGSRKDFRNAVVAAHAAQPGWAKASAYLRSQILYRAAEMLEGRSAQFVEELKLQGSTAAAATREVEAATDLLVHYAGWADKYQQIYSTVNPVASPHFNFSVPEPVGLVAAVAPEKSGLLGLVSVIAPIITGANSCVVLASHSAPLCAVTMAEVFATSDLPGGVVNLLTGRRDELLPTIASHMDVNAVLLCSDDAGEKKLLQTDAALNVKRVSIQPNSPLEGSPYHILDFSEIKTTWHPVGL